MYAPSLAQCLSAASLWALVRSDTLEICYYGIRVVALQPVKIIDRGVTSTTTITRTYTVPPLPGVTSIIGLPPSGIITTTVTGDEPGTETIPPSPGCTDCTSTIRITTVPSDPAVITTSVPGLTPGTETIPPPPDCTSDCTSTVRVTTVPSVPSLVTTTVPGIIPGTETISPPSDCTSDCTSTVRITTVPSVPGILTTTVPGIIPGTETIPPPADCTSDCTSTVRITTVPLVPGLITTTVPGTVPGTETIPPTSGCTSDCTSTIRVTTVPSVPGLITTTVPGPVPGTETVPPTSGCTSDCTSTVRITTVPPVSTEITTTVPGTVPGTETIPPTPGCTDCTAIVRITTVPSPTPSPEPPSPPPGACFFPPGSCDPSSLSLNLYENSDQVDDGYAVSNGQSGVGPDYYLDQQPIDQGSTQSLAVPGGDNADATGESFVPQPPGSPAIFNSFPGLTKSYGGMTFDANVFTIVFTGYFVPETTGTHTFCVNFADNRNPLYIGSDAAFPCGDASNGATPRGATPRADYWFARESEAQCADVEMVAGFHYPLRQVYGNWGTPSSLAVTVQGPGEEATSDVAGRVSNADCTLA